MKKILDTKNYKFIVKNNELVVVFKKVAGQNDIVLNQLNFEITGITLIPKEKDPWTVVIITSENLKKLKLQINENLETIGFHFESLNEAFEALKFITFYLYKLTILTVESAGETHEQ
jgi:hypothetical protein